MTQKYDSKAIFDAVVEHGGIRPAARALQIDRSTVRRHYDKWMAEDPESVIHRNCLQTKTLIDDVSYAWVKTDEVSMFVDRREKPLSYDDLRAKLYRDAFQEAPVYEKTDYSPSFGNHLLVIDPADVHIGKLAVSEESGAEYNTSIAVKRMADGVTDAIRKALPYGLDRIALVIGNDIIHTDTTTRTTTGGTPQDTDGQWWQMFYAARDAYIAAILECVSYAPVHVIFCPSNHDRMSGFMLAAVIHGWFHNHPDVHFGVDQQSISNHPRKYLKYGSNLIGFTHGDDAKEKDLPGLMQHEVREAWGQTKYSYIYTHHFHHKIRNAHGLQSQKLEKDHIGLTVINTGREIDPENNTYVEFVRSPSAPDSWHARNGHISRQAVESFIHHHDLGQVARFTTFF